MGLELTKKLISESYKIGFIVKSERRKSDAINELNNANNVDFFIADLSNREQIQAVAQEINPTNPASRWPFLRGVNRRTFNWI